MLIRREIFIFISKGSNMTDLNLYTRIASLPHDLQNQVKNFIEFLEFKEKSKKTKNKSRLAGKAKGLISIKDNFDEPIEGFNEYLK